MREENQSSQGKKREPSKDTIYHRQTRSNSKLQNTSTTEEVAKIHNEEIKNLTNADQNVYEFSEEDNLETHTENRQAPDKLCKFCNKYFESPLDLLRHKRENHRFSRNKLSLFEVEKYYNHSDRYSCPICNRPLQTKGFKAPFIKHLMTHTDSKMFQCKVCKKSFNRKENREIHERKHIVRPPVPTVK